MKPWVIWGMVLMCWLGGLAVAHAQQGKLVLVLAQRSEDAALTEITARVRGELSGAGFRVLTREPPDGVSPLRAVEQTGLELNPSAVLWIVAAAGHSEQSPRLEIWLSDRLLGKVSMARFGAAPGRASDASALAVQAVELLRARLSELRVEPIDREAEVASDQSWVEQASEPASKPAPPEPSAPDRAREATPRRRAWFGISGGLAVLLDSGSLEPGLLPLLSCVVSPGEPRPGDVPLALDLRLSAAGFGSSQQFQLDQGGAEVAQAFGELSAALRYIPPRVPIEPWLGLGGGVYTVGVQGNANAPYQAHDERAWSALGTLSLGLRSRPWAHLSLGASGALLWAPARASVRIDEDKVAMAGGTLWLVRAELMGVF
jgi:hypothetical protein